MEDTESGKIKMADNTMKDDTKDDNDENTMKAKESGNRAPAAQNNENPTGKCDWCGCRTVQPWKSGCCWDGC